MSGENGSSTSFLTQLYGDVVDVVKLREQSKSVGSNANAQSVGTPSNAPSPAAISTAASAQLLPTWAMILLGVSASALITALLLKALK